MRPKLTERSERKFVAEFIPSLLKNFKEIFECLGEGYRFMNTEQAAYVRLAAKWR